MKKAMFVLFIIVFNIISCSKKSSGFEDVKTLYQKSENIIKSKNRDTIKKFITEISPDKGTLFYMNKNKCLYYDFPNNYINNDTALDSLIEDRTTELYNFSLKLDRENKLSNFKFVEFMVDAKPVMMDSECVGVYFTEPTGIFDSKGEKFHLKFGEFLKINDKWKSLSSYEVD